MLGFATAATISTALKRERQGRPARLHTQAACIHLKQPA